jgi:hypothetical protein
MAATIEPSVVDREKKSARILLASFCSVIGELRGAHAGKP